jgi:5-methylcytosine-specific restriction protein A
MKNSKSLSRFTEELGCRLKIGWHWSASSTENKRALYTIWDDQIAEDRYILLPEGSPSWMKNPGGVQLIKDVELALNSGMETLGILCHAVDPDAEKRERAYFDEKSLLVIELVREKNQVIAVIKGEVLADAAVTGPIAGNSFRRRSAIDDLDIPEGAQEPDRLRVEGFAYKRNRMVRDYVVKRANGHCEYCGTPGFPMGNGSRYIEAHHIIGLGNNGPDTVSNVIGLCPEHHREAHFGKRAVELNEAFKLKVETMEQGMASISGNC